ncbi:MAG TPA: alpha/beta hydrolase [Acidimicrobiales bacterium]|jgi:pimeloyl-ACP methyl ester carboxylesterase
MQIILIHGAWHGPWCWEGVVSELEAAGHAVVAVELPFTGFAHDAAAARSAIIEAGPGVVVCGHSYGGLVVDEAVAGLGTDQVSRILYLAAITNAGLSAMGRYTIPVAEAIVPTDNGYCATDLTRAHALFYADSDPEVVQRITPLLRPMMMDGEAFTSRDVGRLDIRSTFVVCSNDGALPADFQREEAALCSDRVEWPTDHSPFLTRPAAIADLLTKTN